MYEREILIEVYKTQQMLLWSFAINLLLLLAIIIIIFARTRRD